jgi:hypothetical protein
MTIIIISFSKRMQVKLDTFIVEVTTVFHGTGRGGASISRVHRDPSTSGIYLNTARGPGEDA